MRLKGNGVRGMCGECEKDTGKSSKYFKFVFGYVYSLNSGCFNYFICKMIGILVLLLGLSARFTMSVRYFLFRKSVDVVGDD